MTTRRPNAYTQSLQEAQRRAETEQPENQQNSLMEKQLDSKTENKIESKAEKQDASKAESQLHSKAERQKNIKTLRQKDKKTEKQQIKSTFYLEPEDIMAIDELQMLRFRTTGQKPIKSEIVSEAIKLLKQQNIKTENQ